MEHFYMYSNHRGYQVALDRHSLQQNYYFYHTKGAPKELKYPGVSATGDLPNQINLSINNRKSTSLHYKHTKNANYKFGKSEE